MADGSVYVFTAALPDYVPSVGGGGMGELQGRVKSSSWGRERRECGATRDRSWGRSTQWKWVHVTTNQCLLRGNFGWCLELCNWFIPSFLHLKTCIRTSLGTQWLRIRLPRQETRVRALVLDTCRRATKPVHHNYWACALEPAGPSYWAREPQLLKPAHLEPVLCNKRSHRSEKPAHHNEE